MKQKSRNMICDQEILSVCETPVNKENTPIDSNFDAKKKYILKCWSLEITKKS